MGISWSKRHHRHEQLQHHHPPPSSSSSPNPPSPITFPPTTTAPPSPPHGFNHNPPHQPPPTYAFAANAPHPTPPEQHPYPALPPPPPPLPPYTTAYSFSNHYARPVNMMGQYSSFRPYYNVPQIGGRGPQQFHRPAPVPMMNPAPYVDHQSAKKIKNDVNVHKGTIVLRVDEVYPDCHLVSFTFDALVDGSITIFYFAKEGQNCKFTPVYPEIAPVKIPFQKGLGQKFCQPSGTGVDLGFFDTADLANPSPGEDVYPLVISAESSMPMTERSNEELLNASPHAQITQAVLEKKDGGNFQAKVIKQILFIDGARYELREIFGISGSDEAAINDVESGKECIICLTEDKNTAVLPCRHMCMCSDCAKELRLQSNKCPICRQPIEELLEIKVDQEGGV